MPRPPNPIRPRNWGVLIAALLFGAGIGAPASAHAGRSPLEDEVKAAFLFNFAKFVEWPPHAFGAPETPLLIGVLGSADFARTLARVVEGKTAQGRGFRVLSLDAPSGLDGCHVLFVSHETAGLLPRVLESTRAAPVLVVSETDSLARRGAAINFYLEENRVRFEINIAAAARSRLRISSRLLSLARIVEGVPAGG